MERGIGWCTRTANPVTGCIHGCNYCYARKISKRLGGMSTTTYHRIVKYGLDPFTPAFHWDVLEDMTAKLKKRRNPERVFLGSMGDPCCETMYLSTNKGGIKKRRIAREVVLESLLGLMEECPVHTFMLLSKNPTGFLYREWPSNAQIGTSIPGTSDSESMARIDAILKVDAPVRWLSIEPLMDVDFDPAKIIREDSQGNIRLPDWIVVDVMSPSRPSVILLEKAVKLVEFCKEYKIPLYVKKNIRRARRDFKWPEEIIDKHRSLL